MCMYLDSIFVIVQLIAYQINDRNDERGLVLGLEKGELGNADNLIKLFCAPVTVVLILCLISHFWYMKTLVKLSIIISMVISHV